MVEGKVEGGGESAAKGEADGATGVDARIGAIVDKYAIVRLLGKGGMGAVYEAQHAKLARRFAIKFLLPEIAANAEVLRRFENEAKAAGGLEHPNVAAVTDFGRATDGSPYIVMEYLEGENCARLLHRLGPLPVPRAANIVQQACRGLAVAHRAAIVHRDLKPENLFLTDAGDGSDLVKVLDFGIAKLQQTDATLATGTGQTFGTAYYMSPEQARGAGDVDQRADVWSLGVVLYELLSGRRPFVGDQFLHVIHQILSVEPPSLAILRPGIPPQLVAVVGRAMTKNIAERFPSARAFAEALAPFAGRGASVTPARPSQAMAPTVPTPATRVGVGQLPSVASRAVADAPSATGIPTLAARSTVKWIVGGAFVVALIASAVVAVLAMGRKPGRPSSPPGPQTSPALQVEPSTPATASGHPQVAAPSPPPAPPPPPEPAVVARPLQARPPAHAKRGVRTVFEHSEHDSNRRAPRAPASRPAPATPPAAPDSGPKPLPPKAAPAAGHPIEIEKDNPYNN